MGGRAWGGDLIVFVGPGVGHLTDLVLPGEGIFESFFARRGDIWLPTRTKKTETKHMFPTSKLHACTVLFEKIRKLRRPMRTSKGWVDFTGLGFKFCRNVYKKLQSFIWRYFYCTFLGFCLGIGSYVQPGVGKFGCIWLEWFAHGKGIWLQFWKKSKNPPHALPPPPPAGITLIGALLQTDRQTHR